MSDHNAGEGSWHTRARRSVSSAYFEAFVPLMRLWRSMLLLAVTVKKLSYVCWQRTGLAEMGRPGIPALFMGDFSI